MKFRVFIISVVDYFVFGNVLIATCAVVMFRYTAHVFSLQTDTAFVPFIFFATLSSYSLHWYLTKHNDNTSKRLYWSAQHRKFLLVLFILSLIPVGVFFALLVRYYLILLALGFVTFMYTAPKIPVQPFLFIRKIAVLKTTYLTLVWIAVTVITPIVVSGAAWNQEMLLFTINRLFLIFPICVLFDYRDREEDRMEGIKNIATVVTERGLNLVFTLCTLIAFAAAALLYVNQRNYVILISNLAPAVLLVAAYSKSKHSRSDLLFYGYLDGLMMLSGLIALALQHV